MDVFAAVTTGRGTGAISTIQLYGDKAETILGAIFEPAAQGTNRFEPGTIRLGWIRQGQYTIDQVTVARESPQGFAIHCHGNALIVERIMHLLREHGVRLLGADEFLAEVEAREGQLGAIELEARLVQARAKTVEGTRLVVNQAREALQRWARRWSEQLDQRSVGQLQAEAAGILTDSRIGRLIIDGCTVALVGPANSGKSTLLNCLAGREKAIVAEIEGTTRDWVSARCTVGPMSVEFVDTAGWWLSRGWGYSDVELAAQRKSQEILEQAELIVLVLDRSRGSEQLAGEHLEQLAGRKVVTVLNKSDLVNQFEAAELAAWLLPAIEISAKFGTGIEPLQQRMLQVLGVWDFALDRCICFTSRQEKLLHRLCDAQTKEQAKAILDELLSGHVEV